LISIHAPISHPWSWTFVLHGLAGIMLLLLLLWLLLGRGILLMEVLVMMSLL
jgi:hypothetical protein